MKHWFFTNRMAHRVYTAGAGDHPAGNYWFGTLEELDSFAAQLVADGYEFIKDQ